MSDLNYINVAGKSDAPEIEFNFPQEHVLMATAKSSVMTVLTSVVSLSSPEVAPSLNKRYYIDANTGKLALRNYQNAAFFKAEDKPVSNIFELAALLTEMSADNRKMIIRGLQVRNDGRRKRRNNENFIEHPDGTYFVMLDFDKIDTEYDPLTVEAIDSVIAKLPAEFKEVTYYYQHSNSAGILNEAGQPLKQGLNAHVFFWLNRRIKGEDLTAYLKKHCLDTGFYTVGEDKGGSVRVWYGVDTSTIYSAVQPHFTASPTLGSGVQCNLKPEERQGLVTKEVDVVTIPPLTKSTATEVYVLADSIKRQYEKAHGYVHKQLQTFTKNGIASTTYSVNPNAENRSNRALNDVKFSRDSQFLTLYFVGENSPGSWFVSKHNPQFAKRYGDGERVPLKEFSQDAYAYIRDELKWFTELPHRTLPLVNGYLPAINTFATAKVSVILAPTGTGKSYAAIDWIRSKLKPGQIVIYSVPLISLVNQMQGDFRLGKVPYLNYKEVYEFNVYGVHVIATTNKSLRKVLTLIYNAKLPHYIIYDEIHSSFDEFMASNRNNAFFEQSLLKATQTLMMTGTLTNVQKVCLPDVISSALSSLSESAYCCYEFNPVKSNPVTFYPLNRFDSDFITLMDDLSEKLKKNEPLPRVVVLLPTSKMNAYRAIISDRGLKDSAYVVSRPETTQEDIDEARKSQRPILIASPVFNTGVNLVAEPDIFYTRFDNLNADTNQVIQTVNRPNRGKVKCEVRIYGNTDSDSKITLPNKHKLKTEVAERLHNESSFTGLLEEHFQVDRNTYLSLRRIEKNSNRTLSYLKSNNNIQNYTVVEADIEELTGARKAEIKKKNEVFREYIKQARNNYNAAITAQYFRFSQYEIDLCFWKLDKLDDERRFSHNQQVKPRLPCEMDNEKLGVVMVLCGLSRPQEAKLVSIAKIKRLFGEYGPWVSAQFAPEHHPNWAKVQAEKTEYIIVLLEKLAEIKAERLSVLAMVASLSRNMQLGAAFLALADSDSEYLTIAEKLDNYFTRCKSMRASGSDSAKKALREAGRALLEGLLEPIAMFFERKIVNGKTLINYDKLIVPVKWDLTAMASNLTKQALRLRALPVSQKLAVLPVDEGSTRKPMDKSFCEQCVMYHQMECVLSHPVDCFDELLPRSRATNCIDFKVLKIKLVA